MLPETMQWTCKSCGEGGSSKSSTEVHTAQVNHWRTNPYCQTIVVTWVDEAVA